MNESLALMVLTFSAVWHKNKARRKGHFSFLLTHSPGFYADLKEMILERKFKCHNSHSLCLYHRTQLEKTKNLRTVDECLLTCFLKIMNNSSISSLNKGNQVCEGSGYLILFPLIMFRNVANPEEGGGYSQKNWVGVCGLLTLVMAWPLNQYCVQTCLSYLVHTDFVEGFC